MALFVLLLFCPVESFVTRTARTTLPVVARLSSYNFNLDKPLPLAKSSGLLLKRQVAQSTNNNSNSNDIKDAKPENDPSSFSSRKKLHELRKRDWINRSIHYYSAIRRLKTTTFTTDKAKFRNDESSHNNNKNKNTKKSEMSARQLEKENHDAFVKLATKHYFALEKIKKGELLHAERIYRKVIEKTTQNRKIEGHCDHAVLASSTLLLALLLQRTNDIKGTRNVFVNFFRVVGEDEVHTCACSAKVLQAFALFEMKRGLGSKSLYLVERAVELDGTLSPVLEWKQFRDVLDDRKRKEAAKEGRQRTNRSSTSTSDRNVR
eukprot:CAMPEP_0195517808 /NCGR_PEP_ID=MMETSP0794_2-20130614/11732_1 /TAXON_ID=515487 /ORGANISM="Stephanopyxis turris, Strain CCMP 815" /LENGTH=319 /DNA_ID=CAMNT_0040646679 /DNA_START=104 /DNA_END=1063 /DNA_ORIENTATION=-